MRRLANLNERATEHSSVIAYDDSEPRMARLRDELEKHDIEAEVEPVMTGRGERYDLLVPKSKATEADKILTAFHGRGLSRDRSYKLPMASFLKDEDALGERVAPGFTAVTLYIDGERVQIGDPEWIKMTDDIEGTVEELKEKYRGAKVTVTPTGEQEVSIEVERKKSSRLGERSASLGERRTETDENIEHEIGEWLERGKEFELDDINERIGRLGELKVLADNIDHIIHRELKKAIGAGVPSSIVSEIDQSSLNSEGIGGDYRATGKFRIWHDQDAYAQGSFSAEGMAGELQNMTINITQVSGHGKKNPPLRFF